MTYIQRSPQTGLLLAQLENLVYCQRDWLLKLYTLNSNWSHLNSDFVLHNNLSRKLVLSTIFYFTSLGSLIVLRFHYVCVRFICLCLNFLILYVYTCCIIVTWWGKPGETDLGDKPPSFSALTLLVGPTDTSQNNSQRHSAFFIRIFGRCIFDDSRDCGAERWAVCEMEWIGLCMVLHIHQHSIGYMGDGFHRQKNPTNSIKVLKEKSYKGKPRKHKIHICIHIQNSRQLTDTHIKHNKSPSLH